MVILKDSIDNSELKNKLLQKEIIIFIKNMMPDQVFLETIIIIINPFITINNNRNIFRNFNNKEKKIKIRRKYFYIKKRYLHFQIWLY